MKNLNRLSDRNFKSLFFSFLISIIFTLPLYAQDYYVQEIISPESIEYVNEVIPSTVVVGFFVEVPEPENNPPTLEAEVILRLLDFEGIVIFEESYFIVDMTPNTFLEIDSSPDGYLSAEPGIFTFEVSIIAEEDVDPVNNFLSLEFEIIGVFPNPDFQIFQVDMTNPYQIENSTYGVFQYDYVPSETMTYLNVMALHPINGQVDWIVDNLPMIPFEYEQTIEYWFDLSPLGIQNGVDISDLILEINVSETIVLVPFPIENEILIPVQDTYINIYSGVVEGVAEGVPFLYPSVIDYFPTLSFFIHYRGCDVPNIDLDDSENPPSTTYAGDINACGPAAAGNSLKWLEEKHENIYDTGNSLRETVEGLSGHMNRTPNGAVTTDSLVRGKLGYIDQYSLPIHVKYQSLWNQDDSIASPSSVYGHSAENQGSTTTNELPTWEFYKNEMDNGEDVEILFGWYDDQANRHGGHWVNSVGYYEDENKKGIFIKQDKTQSDTGGNVQSYHDWIESTDGWAKLGGFDGPNNNCWIESVVSESYDEDIRFILSDFDLDKATLIGVEDDPLLCTFTFSFIPSEEIRYVNVRARTLNSSEETWIIRNILLTPSEHEIEFRTWWNLNMIGITDPSSLDSIHVEIGVSDEISYAPTFLATILEDVTINEVHYNVERGVRAFNTLNPNPVHADFPTQNDQDITTYIYRDCSSVPNIDLHSETDSTTSDINACVPAATANSMHWLEDVHDEINTDLTLREKLEELKDFMNHNDTTGVTLVDMVKGKLAYIDEHNLPIHVKFQGDGYGDNNTTDIDSPNENYGHSADNRNEIGGNLQPTWEFLTSELEDGEDVELCYGTYYTKGDSTWRAGGHAVLVNGANEAAGVKRIAVKHDWDQEAIDPDKVSQDILTWNENDSVQISFLELSNFFIEDGDTVFVTRKVDGVIAESYDSTITFDLSIRELLEQNFFNLIVIKNPSSVHENIQIEFTLEESSNLFLEIYNQQGQQVYVEKMRKYNKGKYSYTVEAKPLNSAGTYFLKLRNKKGFNSTVKVVRK